MRRHVAVLGLDQHGAIRIHENGAEGMVAMGQRSAGDFERPAQEILVELRCTHIRKVVHGAIMQTADPTRKDRDQGMIPKATKKVQTVGWVEQSETHHYRSS